MSAKAAFIKDGELSAKIAVQQFLGDRQNPCALSFPVASTTTGKDHEAKSEAFPRRGDSSKVITCAASPPRRPMLRERGSVREKPTDREPAYPPRRSERPTGRPRGSPENPEAGNLPTPGSPHVSFESWKEKETDLLEDPGCRVGPAVEPRDEERLAQDRGVERPASADGNVAAACPRATVTAVGSSRAGKTTARPSSPGERHSYCQRGGAPLSKRLRRTPRTPKTKCGQK